MADGSQCTPRQGMCGVGMVLRTRDAENLGMRTPRPRPQSFIIKELLPGGAAAECGLITVGDRLVSVDGRKVHGLPLQQVQALIRGPPATTVTLTAVSEWETKPREYAVVLVRGGEEKGRSSASMSATPVDMASPHSAGLGAGDRDFPCATPGPDGQVRACSLMLSPDGHLDLTAAGNPRWSEASVSKDPPAEWICTNSAFWEVGQKKMQNLISVAKSEKLRDFRDSAVPLYVPVEDTARCLQELRVAMASDDVDSSAAGRLSVIEDVAFLRDQVRNARSEMMEDHLFAHRQELCRHNLLQSRCRECNRAGGFFSSLFSSPVGMSPRAEQAPLEAVQDDQSCERCARLFAHVKNLESQRSHMEKSIVRHRLRVGQWEKNRLKTESALWLCTAQLGASLEQIRMELEVVRRSLNQDAPMLFFSSVLMGNKRGAKRASSGALRAPTNLQANAMPRRSLPTVSRNAAAILRHDLSAGSLEALREEEGDAILSNGVVMAIGQASRPRDTPREHDQAPAAMTALEERLSRADRENAALKKELLTIANLETKIEELEALRVQDAAELARIQGGAAYVELMRACKSAEDEIKSLAETKEQLEEVNLHNRALTSELVALKTENSELPKLREQLDKSEMQAEETAKALRAVVSTLKSQLESAEASSAERLALIAGLEEDLSAARARIVTFESEAEVQRAGVATLESQLGLAEASSAERLAVITRLEATVAEQRDVHEGELLRRDQVRGNISYLGLTECLFGLQPLSLPQTLPQHSSLPL